MRAWKILLPTLLLLLSSTCLQAHYTCATDVLHNTYVLHTYCYTDSSSAIPPPMMPEGRQSINPSALQTMRLTHTEELTSSDHAVEQETDPGTQSPVVYETPAGTAPDLQEAPTPSPPSQEESEILDAFEAESLPEDDSGLGSESADTPEAEILPEDDSTDSDSEISEPAELESLPDRELADTPEAEILPADDSELADSSEPEILPDDSADSESADVSEARSSPDDDSDRDSERSDPSELDSLLDSELADTPEAEDVPDDDTDSELAVDLPNT